MQFGSKFFQLWLQQTADPDLYLSLKIETNVNCIFVQYTTSSKSESHQSVSQYLLFHLYSRSPSV